MSEEEDERIPSFTVKDALYLHDKKIGDTQRIVSSFEDKFKVLMERINEGVSPTMRRIEAKQGEIEKQIIQLDAKVDVKSAEINSQIKVLDNHFHDKFVEVDRFLAGLRDLKWKLIGVVLMAVVSTFIAVMSAMQTYRSLDVPVVEPKKK